MPVINILIDRTPGCWTNYSKPLLRGVLETAPFLRRGTILRIMLFQPDEIVYQLEVPAGPHLGLEAPHNIFQQIIQEAGHPSPIQGSKPYCALRRALQQLQATGPHALIAASDWTPDPPEGQPREQAPHLEDECIAWLAQALTDPRHHIPNTRRLIIIVFPPPSGPPILREAREAAAARLAELIIERAGQAHYAIIAAADLGVPWIPLQPLISRPADGLTFNAHEVTHPQDAEELPGFILPGIARGNP